MPNWKKVIVSGSDASLNSLLVTNGATVTGSLNVSSSLSIVDSTYTNQTNTLNTETKVIYTLAGPCAIFVDYVVINGNNVRAGAFVGATDGNDRTSYETATNDIGNTSDVTFSLTINAGDLEFNCTTLSDSWVVKTNIRTL
jgi:hypothetical protein